jgi:hypothetical protein
VDLRGTTILNKNPEALAWKIFHKLHFKYYYSQFPSMLLFAHTFFMNNTFPYLITKYFFHTSILLIFSPPKTQDTPLPPWYPLLELVSLSNGSWKSFPPINGLLILHEPMRIENDFSLQWK